METGAGGFYNLILGLMLTIFGGMAFCYGLVKLGEKIVHRFHAGHAAPVAVPAVLPVTDPPIRHAA